MTTSIGLTTRCQAREAAAPRMPLGRARIGGRRRRGTGAQGR